MYARRASLRDLCLLRRWRNEELVRRWSGTTQPIGPVEHCRWFLTSMGDDSSEILIILNQAGCRVGTVQFRCERVRSWTVSITIDPKRRNEGLGTLALSVGEDWLVREKAPYELRAMIHPENQASRRLFVRRGFAELGLNDSGFALYVKSVSGNRPI